MKIGYILRDLYKEIDPNPSLLVSYWANPEWFPKKEKEKDGKEEETKIDVWLKLSSTTKLGNRYLKFLKNLELLQIPNLSKISESYITRTRLIIGAGASGWEVPLVQMLKPFGVPWIPGSTLKGVMRQAASLRLINKNSELGYLLGFRKESKLSCRSYEDMSLDQISRCLKEIKLGNQITEEFMKFVKLFGTKYYKGELLVLGGFPVGPNPEGSIVKVEVISPHYKEYYEGKEYPSETSSPIPLFFPVVSEGVVFEFLLFSSKELEGYVKDLLKDTLINYGVGGKQSSGFGLFSEIKDRPR